VNSAKTVSPIAPDSVKPSNQTLPYGQCRASARGRLQAFAIGRCRPQPANRRSWWTS